MGPGFESQRDHKQESWFLPTLFLLYPSHPNRNNNLTNTFPSVEKKTTFAADFKKEITKHGKGQENNGFND